MYHESLDDKTQRRRESKDVITNHEEEKSSLEQEQEDEGKDKEKKKEINAA